MNIAWWHSFFGTYRYETGPPVPLVHGGLPPNAQDGPRGEVPAWWRVLFRAAFLRTCYVEVGITGSVGVRGAAYDAGQVAKVTAAVGGRL